MLETVKGYKTVAFNVIVGLLLVWRAVRPADRFLPRNRFPRCWIRCTPRLTRSWSSATWYCVR